MAMYYMNLAPEPFEKIVRGTKTIEMRLDDERRQGISAGDRITFTNNSDGSKLVVKVLAVHKFANFAELYRTLDLTKCGYSAEEVATARPTDMDVYYSRELQSQYGVLGLEVQTEAVFPACKAQ